MSGRQSGLFKKEVGYVDCSHLLDGKHGKWHVH